MQSAYVSRDQMTDLKVETATLDSFGFQGFFLDRRQQLR